MTEKTRIGIIGVGQIAKHRLDNYGRIGPAIRQYGYWDNPLLQVEAPL